MFHLITKNNAANNLKIGYDNKLIPNVSGTKFRGIIIDITVYVSHTEQLMSKLNTACYVFRSIKTYTSHTKLIVIYYSIFHSITNYGLIFGGNSSYNCKNAKEGNQHYRGM